MLVILAAAAFAQDPECVPASVDALRMDLDSVEVALRDGEADTAAGRLDEVMSAFPCSTTPLAPWDVARVARLASLLAFAQQDTGEVERWAALWKAADPTVGPLVKRSVDPDAWLELVAPIAPGAPTGPAGKGLAPPKGGLVVIDGEPALKPVAVAEIPHLVQVWDKKGELVAGMWQDGAAFDDAWLGEPTELVVPPWWDEHLATRGTAPPPLVAPVRAAPAEEAPSEEVVAPAPSVVGPIRVGTPRVVAPVQPLDMSACAWGAAQPTAVEATNKAVTIEGRAYPIRTQEDMEVLKTELRECHEFRAARRFDRWQDARGKAFSSAAKEEREAMLRFLVEPEPERPGKRGRRAVAPPGPTSEE